MNNDLRTIKTKKAILNAFLSELVITNFEDITITSLCQKAEIRRATFYNHFQDKFELLAYTIRNIVCEFTKEYSFSELSYEEILLKFAEDSMIFLTENKEMILSFRKSNLLPLLNSIMFEEVKKELEICYNQLNIKQTKEQQFKHNMLVNYHFEGIFGAVKWWINEKEPITKKQLTNEVLTIIKVGFKGHFENTNM